MAQHAYSLQSDESASEVPCILITGAIGDFFASEPLRANGFDDRFHDVAIEQPSVSEWVRQFLADN